MFNYDIVMHIYVNVKKITIAVFTKAFPIPHFPLSNPLQ